MEAHLNPLTDEIAGFCTFLIIGIVLFLAGFVLRAHPDKAEYEEWGTMAMAAGWIVGAFDLCIGIHLGFLYLLSK